jgi:hypothetical protein
MTRPLILIGYLGKDPEIRQTRVRTIQGMRKNPIAQVPDPLRVQPAPSRFHRRLPRHPRRQGRTTLGLRWNGDQLCHRNLRFAGKGDRVKVKVRPETFCYKDDDGHEHKLRQLIVLRFRVLQRKHIPPEIP